MGTFVAGGAGGGTTDAVARATANAALAKVDQIVPDPAASVPAGQFIIIDGTPWENVSGGARPLPNPANTATMNADAGFEEFQGGGGAAKWTGPYAVSTSPAKSEFVDGVWKGSFNTGGGDLVATIPAGCADGDEFHIFTQGGNILNVIGTGETVGGFPVGDGADFNIDGSAVFKKSGTNWEVINLAPANPASPDATDLAPGQYYFSSVSGPWVNRTAGIVPLPPAQTITNMRAAGLTKLSLMTT